MAQSIVVNPVVSQEVAAHLTLEFGGEAVTHLTDVRLARLGAGAVALGPSWNESACADAVRVWAPDSREEHEGGVPLSAVRRFELRQLHFGQVSQMLVVSEQGLELRNFLPSEQGVVVEILRREASGNAWFERMEC